MTLWEEANVRFQYLSESMAMLEGVVDSLQADVVGSYIDRFPEVPTRDVRYIRAAQDPTTAPGGVYGYGLVFNRPAQAAPAVIVQAGLAPLGGAPIGLTPFGSVAATFGVDRWPPRTVAVGLPPPQTQIAGTASPQAQRNMSITIGSKLATLGLAVSTRECSRAYTTAGHAAPTTPAPVRDDGGREIGTVTRSTDITDQPPPGPTADVALIELLDDTSEKPWVQGAVDAAQERDEIAIYGRPHSKPTWIRLLSPSLALTRDTASWGEVAITADAISDQGDSGAIVTRPDGAVVGQIVAGYRGIYSVVQDIEYCLRHMDATIR